ncbi:tetratricopeptide repeat protein [Chryseolinea soli]|uniref:histidine kinase n=1 Tax=Chryseolinea soli TaxID=2321403 RepID=A0A385SVI8_9BACT|nr:tetratricopeptide repeat protein [Chryseolinea soli]AYB35229.1 hypothetical protein D4L85_33645 [Chryseolinea soli]
MYQGLKFFLGVYVLLLTVPLAAQPAKDPDLVWYESFFQGKKAPVDKALAKQQAALKNAVSKNDKAAEAAVLKEIGMLHLTGTENREQAMDYFIRALAIEDSLALNSKQVFTYMAIARVFSDIGDYNKSEESLENALVINRTLRNTLVHVTILNQLGQVRAVQGEREAALRNYEEVLAFKDEINDPRTEAAALFNIAHLQTQEGNYDEALATHKRALALSRSVRDKAGEALSLNDIGELYRLMKNNDKALANHVASLEVRQALKDRKGIADSYNNIGALYYQQKNYARAVANLQLALDAAREVQDQSQTLKSYEYLSASFKELGDYKKAWEFKDQQQLLQEFMNNDKNEHQLLETQNRYEIEKKESQIGHLQTLRLQREKELRTQKKLQNFLFLLVGLTVVVAALVLYLYLVKRRSNKILEAAHATVNEQNLKLQELNATKDKFFSIISHDLKGPLNSLTSFSGLLLHHTDSLSKEEIQMLAKDLDKSVKNLFALLENLLEWSRSQTGNIEFKPEVFDLNAVVEENRALLKAQAQQKKITLNNAGEGAWMVRAHKNSINTVVRNLISNAIKFTGEGGQITTRLRRQNGRVIIAIADNGVGMSPEVMKKLFRIEAKHSTKGTADEKGTGLGLILCREFVEKNGGQIWVESEEGRGSVFSFSVPPEGAF